MSKNKATAISYTSESSDHYLSLYTEGETAEEIVESERKKFADEFFYLYVNHIESSYLDVGHLEDILLTAISEDIE